MMPDGKILLRDDAIGRGIRWIVFAAPFVFIAGLVALKLDNWRLYWKYAAREDSPVEYLTAAVYAVGSILAFGLTLRFRRRRELLYATLTAFLAAGMLFVGLEEISYGQRIFGWESTGVFAENNLQSETNLHNFVARYPLHMAFILVGLYGTVAFVLVPKAGSRLLPRRYEGLTKLITPPWFLASYFFPTFLLYAYYDYLSPVLAAAFGEGWDWQRGRGGERFIIGKDQEPVELILGMGFLLFVISLYDRWPAGVGGREKGGEETIA